MINKENNPQIKHDERGRVLHKTLMIVSSKFGCDNRCPYCTAKITNWSQGNDHFEKMTPLLNKIRDSNIAFEYVTISGNGEPSMYPINSLKSLRDIFEEYGDLFRYKRFQTSGNIFYHPDKHDLFRDNYVFEITRTSIENESNMKTLRIPRKRSTSDYTLEDRFWQSKIVFNHTLLKDNVDHIIDDIHNYLNTYSNLYMLNLKILNVNTKDETELNSPGSQWILQNGILRKQSEQIAELISKHFPLTEKYDEFIDRVVFEGTMPNGKKIPITFFARKSKYGQANVVFYRGKLIDYQLNEIEVTPNGIKILCKAAFE